MTSLGHPLATLGATDPWFALTLGADSVLYALNFDGHLASIDPTTGNVTDLGDQLTTVSTGVKWLGLTPAW